MKMILSDNTELIIEGMSRDIFSRNENEERSLRIEIDRSKINTEEIETIFTDENLAKFSLVNDVESVEYNGYTLHRANEFMTDERTSVNVSLIKK